VFSFFVVYVCIVGFQKAALTGESLPVTMHEADEARMGSTVVRGETEATVIATGMQTFLGKTASMLSGPVEISNLQKLLIKIMIILVFISTTLCAIAFTFLINSGEDVKSALSFTVVLLVASIPIAIEIVCTTTLALGSRQLALDGAIVSRLAAIEDLAGKISSVYFFFKLVVFYPTFVFFFFPVFFLSRSKINTALRVIINTIVFVKYM
jgi:H+-transporting ATPase